MAKIAFLGLGHMGIPMASRLIEAGHELTVWNRTPAKASELERRGARLASSPREAGSEAELAITMLATPEAVTGVVSGPDGLAAGLRPGAALLEMSTIGPEAARAVAGLLPGGVAMLDAPVVGSVPQATAGELKILVGGEAQLFERWRPVLEVIGKPRHVGPLGSGAAMKLVVNSTLGDVIAVFAEAMALSDGLGLPEGATLDVLADSLIGGSVRAKRANVESGTYRPAFKLSLAKKDMRLVMDAAARAGRELKLARATLDWMETAERAGHGEEDLSVVVAQVRGGAAG